MPLPEGLLNPIPGQNPSGQSLRLDPLYDKIREARRAEEELKISDDAAKRDFWTPAVLKKADFVQVIKLATEALSKRTKDLQIAAWLTEALLGQDRIAGLTQGLGLLRGLIENFWDTLYPEADEGDAGMRAAPLDWVGSRLDIQVRRVPLTKNKLDWFKFQESRKVPYEKDATENEAKKEARQAALEEKRCTPEEFDEGVKITGDAFYRQLTDDLLAAIEAAQALETLTDEKFPRDDAPNFANLKKALEDLQDAVREYWKPPEEKPPEPPEEEPQLEQVEVAPQVASGDTPPRKRATASEEPADAEEAVRRVTALTRFLRTANPSNPVPYLLLRGLRWGELRVNGLSLDAALLESPSSEIRLSLKNCAAQGQWPELLEGVETAMGLPCGRGWLDLQRYAVGACENLGLGAVAAAISAELRSLLSDFPTLPSAYLSDGTQAANNETQTWITAAILPPPPEPPEPPIVVAPPPPSAALALGSNGTNGPDVQELVQQAVRSGRIQDAVELLSREISQERSGRARFLRKVQLAELCLSVKQETIAYPILTELAEEIERRRLEEWEEPSLLAQALLLLFGCMGKLGYEEAAKQKIYQKICRLDPVKVLSATR
ncbi:MAG TPA: type VI secretion system protein TssA [Candidatus Acidoferrum sp.]